MHEQPFSRRACLQTQILSEIEMYFLILNWFQAAIVFLAFCPISNPVLFPHYCIDEVQLIVTAHPGSEVVLKGIEESNKLELKLTIKLKFTFNPTALLFVQELFIDICPIWFVVTIFTWNVRPIISVVVCSCWSAFYSTLHNHSLIVQIQNCRSNEPQLIISLF